MATEPDFASTVRTECALIGVLETDLKAPTQAATVFTAGASGSKIEEIVIEAVTTSLTPTTAAGLVYLFLYDGLTYHLYDVIPVTAVVASATVAPFRATRVYANLILENGWSLRASQSVATNNSLLKVHAFGGDF